MTHTITLIPGDGIGPEVTEAVVRIEQIGYVTTPISMVESVCVVLLCYKQNLPSNILGRKVFPLIG